MITKARIHNFKSLRDVAIDLERFTVFVGPNASGKSSILRSLYLVSTLFHADVSDGGILEGEIENGLSRGATPPVEFFAEFDGRRYRYRSNTPQEPAHRPHLPKLAWS